MEMSDWIQVVIIVGSMGTMMGYLKTSIYYICQKIDKLEIKQDKHNNLIERMICVEQRIDGLEKGANK